MGKGNFTRELELGIAAGIRYLKLDMYEAAKQAFANTIEKADESEKTNEKIGKKYCHHHEIHSYLKSRAAFGFGFSEGLIERKAINEPYRNLDELTTAAKEFCSAKAAFDKELSANYHMRMGKNYANMGFKSEAMRVIDCCKKGDIIFCYYHK